MNRFLLSIPVLFAASITAAACSSSSSPAGGTGTDSGTPATNPDCATLAACCASLGGSLTTMCESVVTAGGTGCSTSLVAAQKAGDCKGGTTGGPDGGTGTPDTGITHPHDTGVTNPGDTGMTTGDTGAPTGCNPTLPAGFAPSAKTAGAAGSCTSTTLTALVEDCFGYDDAGTAANCPTDVSGTCGSCGLAEYTASQWAPFIIIPEMTAQVDLLYPYGDPTICVAQVDPTNGPACKTAYEALVQCELASCVANCPIASSTDTAGTDALLGSFDQTTGALTAPGCIENADTATCTTYAMAFQTACATDLGDGSAGTIFGQCGSLDLPDTIGEVCGGADAGL